MSSTALTTLRVAPGSSFMLTTRTRGVIHVSTDGSVQFVSDHTPLTLDVDVHLLPDGSSAVSRARVLYRYGNPQNFEIDPETKHDVVTRVLGHVHDWRQTVPDSTLDALVGTVTPAPADLEDQVAALTATAEVQEAAVRSARAEVRAASARLAPLEEELSTTRSQLNALKRVGHPEYVARVRA